MAGVGSSGGSPAAGSSPNIKKCALPTFIGTLVGTLLTFIGGLIGIEPVRAWGCRIQPIQSAISSFMCEDKYRPINEGQATQFLTRYYSMAAGGNNLKDAWGLMDKDAQERVGKQEWEQANRKLLWAEVIGPVFRKSEYNEFLANVREYQLGPGPYPKIYRNGHIVTYSRPLELRREGNSILLHREEIGGRTSTPQTVNFPRLTVTSPDFVHELPRLDSRPVGRYVPRQPGLTNELGFVGGQVPGVCQVDQPSPPLGAGWWTRITEGWVRNSTLGDGELGRINEVPECDHSVLNRVPSIGR